eukprot:SAG25_NODE_445_length_7958_cov_9.538109_4_plen_90_part_00
MCTTNHYKVSFILFYIITIVVFYGQDRVPFYIDPPVVKTIRCKDRKAVSCLIHALPSVESVESVSHRMSQPARQADEAGGWPRGSLGLA